MFGRFDANLWTTWAGALAVPEERSVPRAEGKELDAPRGGKGPSSSSTLLNTVGGRMGAGVKRVGIWSEWALGRGGAGGGWSMFRTGDGRVLAVHNVRDPGNLLF
jgi:hypothetical protein